MPINQVYCHCLSVLMGERPVDDSPLNYHKDLFPMVGIVYLVLLQFITCQNHLPQVLTALLSSFSCLLGERLDLMNGTKNVLS